MEIKRGKNGNKKENKSEINGGGWNQEKNPGETTPKIAAENEEKTAKTGKKIGIKKKQKWSLAGELRERENLNKNNQKNRGFWAILG